MYIPKTYNNTNILICFSYVSWILLAEYCDLEGENKISFEQWIIFE
jgi:hypothetical protein